MTITEPGLLLLLVGLISAAALVNGMIGFGFGLLAVNVLASALDPKNGIIVMSLMAPMMSGLQVWRHRRSISIVARLRSVIAWALVGSVIGTHLLVVLPTPVVALVLGVFTLWFVATSLREERPPLPVSTQRWLGPVAGLVGGVSNGAIGASGPVFGTYLTAIGLRGAEFAIAISCAFFTMGILRIGLLAALGQYTLPLVAIAATLAVPSILVQRAGFLLQGRLPRATLYRAVLVVLFVGGLNLVGKALADLLP